MIDVDGPSQQGSIPKLLATPEEAAQALGVGRTKVFELLKDGSLGSVLIGGSRRIPVVELIRLVTTLAQTECDSGK